MTRYSQVFRPHPRHERCDYWIFTSLFCDAPRFNLIWTFSNSVHFIGRNDHDHALGSEFADRLEGHRGNDCLSGRGGNDILDLTSPDYSLVNQNIKVAYLILK